MHLAFIDLSYGNEMRQVNCGQLYLFLEGVENFWDL